MATGKERIPGAGSANILGAISYIPIIGTVLALVVLLTSMRRNRYMEYHAWQGGTFSVLAPLVVKIIWPLVGGPQGLLMQGLGFPPFTWLFWLIGFILNVGLIVFIVWYIYLALLNEYFEVPVVISIVEPFMIYQSEEAAEGTPETADESAEAPSEPEGGEEAPAE